MSGAFSTRPPRLRLGITGASGLIGRHLAAYLSSRHPQYSLRCLARKIPDHAPAEDLEWMPGDLMSDADCREFVADLDVIVHLAHASHPAGSDRDWAADHDANGRITLNLLNALRDREGGSAHLVYAGSGGATYGAWRGEPFREEDPCLPLSPYGIHKLTTEHYLRLAVTQGWLTARVLRISNAYGAVLPPEQRQGVIGVALGRLMQDLPVKLFGPAETVRDYIHLDDLAEALCAAAQPVPGFSVVNIGSGVGVSTREVFEIIGQVTGRSLEIAPADYGSRAFALTPKVILNVSRARKEFGWSPKIHLAEGIRRTWKAATCSHSQ